MTDKTVPREPTHQMIADGLRVYTVTGGDLWADTAAMWQAMWDAAPSAPAQEPRFDVAWLISALNVHRHLGVPERGPDFMAWKRENDRWLREAAEMLMRVHNFEAKPAPAAALDSGTCADLPKERNMVGPACVEVFCHTPIACSNAGVCQWREDELDLTDATRKRPAAPAATSADPDDDALPVIAWQHLCLVPSDCDIGPCAVIHARVKELWVKVDAKHVEHYTVPLVDGREASARLSALKAERDELMAERECLILDYQREYKRAKLSEQERKELEQSADLRWNADMRAIKRWQAEAPERDLTWPDHIDLCVWLLWKLEAAEAQKERCAGNTAGEWRALWVQAMKQYEKAEAENATLRERVAELEQRRLRDCKQIDEGKVAAEASLAKANALLREVVEAQDADEMADPQVWVKRWNAAFDAARAHLKGAQHG